MRIGLFKFSAAIFVLAATACAQRAPQPGAIPTGSAHYKIVQDGKTLGESQFNIQAIASGYTITSTGKMNLAKFSYAFSNTQKLDPGLNLVTDQLSGVVNGTAVTFNAASDVTGRQFIINISANGKKYNNGLDRNLNTVLLPDFDAAGYTLLASMATHPPADAWALIPKENGLLVPMKFVPKPDLDATLDGKRMEVKHTTVDVSTQNAVSVEIYYLPDGQLMETDLPEQNYFVIRDGFKLKSRPKSSPPPASAAPAQPPQQTQAPPQQ